MKRLLVIALIALVAVTGCNYRLGQKSPGVRYSMDYQGCRFSYSFWQDGPNSVAEVADFSQYPGVYTCQITVQVWSHDGQGHVSPGPVAGPLNFGAIAGSPPPLRSVTPGQPFGFTITLTAWQPVNPDRRIFSHSFGGSVLG